MIISRTPLRVSFVGGGSDLPSYYRAHGGAVLSMSIAKHIYLSMHRNFDERKSILKYSRLESVDKISDIEHRILRQVFSDYNIIGVDFSSSADVPSGTGLGSSSCFTVGLINLCNAYRGAYESRQLLAKKACEIEIDKLGEPIGKQDQYACAMGGLNFIQFHKDDSVTVEAVPLTHQQRRDLEQNLLMFYLGGSRAASELLARQTQAINSSVDLTTTMGRMVDQAYGLRREILANVNVLGPYLDEGWRLKRSLSSGISSPAIDDAYARALEAGATGGKLLGAGGAGFLLIYAPNGRTDEVRAALADFNSYDVVLDTMGASIIYAD